MFFKRSYMNKGGVNRETPEKRPPAPPTPKPKKKTMFEDIEEITYKPRKVQNAINQLIRNQKKIISKLEEIENDRV